jgi:hypothetical protein
MDASQIQDNAPKRKRPAKSSTPSFVLTLPLRTTIADERALRIRLDAGRVFPALAGMFPNDEY